MNIDPRDVEFEESIIDAVRENPDSYELTQNGWTIGCPKVEGLPAPTVGETMRLYGRGIGHTVRGIVVGGRVYRYLTAAKEKERHEAWCREQEEKREREMIANLSETDRRLAALPPLFQERIAKFQRDGGPEFRRDYEPYELFCCEQAVAIADALHTAEAIVAFHAAPWDEQKRLVPGLSDGHSGNTFGTACMLARAYVEKPEFVAKLHGALTPLVGCEAYGCKHEAAK
jgi:hypothetical protein